MAISVGGEARWWLLELRDAWSRHKVCVALYVGAVLVSANWESARPLLAFITALIVLSAVWRRYAHGRSLVEHKHWRWQREFAKWVGVAWPELMVRLGLIVRGANGAAASPRVVSLTWRDSYTLVVALELPLGMERSRLTLASPAIAESFGAMAVSVEVQGSRLVALLRYADPLMTPFLTNWPGSDVDLRSIPLGRTEAGSAWSLRIGPHTLVAGSSGSGKASMIWGLLIGLAPAIKSNLVQVLGIDLKGGMELTMGRALLTRYATEPEAAVELLEDAVLQMRSRALELAGKVREHTATTSSPHVVIVIDELAALTAYQTDRDLLRRANNALALLCSQGRAPGFTVFACLQDPRKETLPVRGLFTQPIGLRLRDALETSMVLGEGMREKGALCHKIPANLPGVAYVVPEDGRDPIRVRAGHSTDELIAGVAEAFPAPHPFVAKPTAPEPSESTTPSRPRRPRRTPRTGEES